MKLFKILTLSILCCFSSLIYAQTPGGVTLPIGATTEYWLRADQVQATLPADGADVTTWQDLSGTGRNFTKAANPFAPRFTKSSMNFHSAVDFYFDEDNTSRQRTLETGSVFNAVTGRTYYVIQVSKLDDSNSTTDATVISLTGADQYNAEFGWRNSGELWQSTSGTAGVAPSLGKGYGIGIYKINAGIATVSNAAREIINDATVTTLSADRITARANNISLLGGEEPNSNTSNDLFRGEIQEVIVLSTITGTALSASDIQKINTYLAVKYGLTLSASQTNYINSAGTSIYDSSSTGYTGYTKDIFGIARDDASGLYQKQSISTDNGVLAVYLGSTLAETNAENTNTLVDKDALMFGANGSTGNATYSYPVGTAFQNYTLQSTTDASTGVVTQERLSTLFNYKLRAKTTGTLSQYTVGMKPGIGEWVLVSSDPTFAPANTRIYKIVGGNVSNVVVNNGDYVGFASFIKAPGGVANGLKMWLNASEKNTITLNAAGEVVNWVDYSGYGTTYSKINSSSTAPLYLQCDPKLNFHPGANFRKNNEFISTLKGPMSVASPADYTFYAALYHSFSSYRRGYYLGFGNTSAASTLYPALGIGKNGTADAHYSGLNYINGFRNGNAILPATSVPRMDPNATTVAYNNVVKGISVKFELEAFGGTLSGSGFSTMGSNSRLNGPGTLGIGYTSTRNIIGSIGEVIAYEGAIATSDKTKIDSYLGLKYATTLDTDINGTTAATANFKYIFSDLSTVWDGNSAPWNSYHHNVASVVRDDVQNLNNKQAKSTDYGDDTVVTPTGNKIKTDVMHMGVGSKLGCAPVVTGLALDLAAVTWGHDVNKGLDTSFTAAACATDITQKLARKWLVETTANLLSPSQEMLIYMYYDADIFPYQNNANVYMLVDNNGDTTNDIGSNSGWTNVIPGVWVTDHYEFRYKFSKAHTFVTFGAKPSQPICTACEFQGQKKIDFKRGTGTNLWTNGMTTQTYDLTDVKVKVSTTVAAPTRWVTNYPRADRATRSLREYRRSISTNGGTGTDIMLTKIQIYKPDGVTTVAASAKFDIYEISRRYGRLDKVKVYGKCGGSIVTGRLTYVNTPARYDILDQQNAQGKRYSSYTNRRGMMHVEFDVAVEEIDIEHTFPIHTYGVVTGRTRIGIGPITLTCPKPLPPPNEDGFVFTKEAESPVQTCDPVKFTYRVYNTATCDVKTVNFSDTLPSTPSKMYWMGTSASISSSTSDATIDASNNAALAAVETTGSTTNYADAQTLAFTGLKIPAQGYITISGTAYFEQGAADGTYDTHQAIITYTGGTTSSLSSCDRYTDGCATTYVIATAVQQPKPIKITDFYTDKSCFSGTGDITVFLKVNNTGDSDIPQSQINFGFEPAAAQGVTGTKSFVYDPTYGIQVTKTDGTAIATYVAVNGPTIDDLLTDEGDVETAEDANGDGSFTIPAGESIISFKVKYNDLVALTGNPEFTVGFDLLPYSTGDCTPLVLNSFDDITLQACAYCTKPGNFASGGNPSKVGITVQSKKEGWPENIPNGFITLESKSKGLVITRVQNVSLITDAKEGMLVYDIEAHCTKLYNGSQWKCIARACND